jgi:hypothetical protein
MEEDAFFQTSNLKETIMQRRMFLLSSFLTALAADATEASQIDPKETLAPRHIDIKFAPWNGLPPGGGEMADLFGDFNKPEPYLVPMKRNPGWFSAPHGYGADRVHMAVSGTRPHGEQQLS